jgi:DNA repair protein RadA/Sms
LKEAAKLGFSQAIAPTGTKTDGTTGMSMRKLGDLVTFTGEMFGAG